MAVLFVEISCEEIPARMQQAAITALESGLVSAHLWLFGHGNFSITFWIRPATHASSTAPLTVLTAK